MMEESQKEAASFVQQSVLEGCFKPLLAALNWHGRDRRLQEAMPHAQSVVSINAFCQVMENLNYTYNSVPVRLDEIDKRLFPCLFIAHSGAIKVLLSRSKQEITVFNGESGKEEKIAITDLEKKPMEGHIYVFQAIDPQKKGIPDAKGWIKKAYIENKALIKNGLFLSLMLNILMLSTPIFIMSVYDKVVGASSVPMLGGFLVGIAIAMIGIFIIHRIRSKMLAMLGARLDRTIGDHVLRRLLYLAPQYTEMATVGSQVARVKDFDRLREFLSGPLLIVFFDLPFIIIALLVIAVLGHLLVFVPVIMIVVFLLLGMVMRLKLKRRLIESSRYSSDQQEFLLESVTNLRVLKYTAAEDVWMRRCRDYIAAASFANFRVTMVNSVNTAISDAIMIGAGMAVLSFGALMVMNETLTVGAMVAVMILIWRTLAPLKNLFNTLPRLEQVIGSLQQIGRLMNLNTEADSKGIFHSKRYQLKGDVAFQRVSMRYPGSYDPALMGVDFKIKTGELIGMAGRNGSGKSTILKLILALYQPQAGHVLLDNQDIRQLNPIELREMISYLPQTPELFYGTIATNLRLADPAATNEMLEHAAERAGVLDYIRALPDGFNTHIGEYAGAHLSASLQQGICLARAYIKASPILLLDEPATTLDPIVERRMLEHFDVLRGKTTVIMVSRRPSHLKKMDRVFLMEQGQLAIQGTPEEVMPKIPREFL